jgi:hypothetical protein
MRLNAAVAIAAATVVAACCAAAPRAAYAQARKKTQKKTSKTIMVETLPPSDVTPRNPWYIGPPDLKAASRLAGCFTVTLGPWSDALATGDSVPIPPRVDLLDSLHTGFYIGFRLVARTPGFAMPMEKRPPAWSPVEGDSLQVGVWHEGTRSVTLFLRRRPDAELRGTARYFSPERMEDSATGRWMWEKYPAAPVSLRPTPCEASGSQR